MVRLCKALIGFVAYVNYSLVYSTLVAAFPYLRKFTNRRGRDRSHPANEVYVTGTFDDWGKSVKLDKSGDTFEKEVSLSNADEKILYKVGHEIC